MRHPKIVASGLLAFAFACATNSTTNDPLSDLTPRAQGTIILGASHAPGSSTVTPSVSVSFVPDTTKVLTACGQQTEDTCVFTQAPDCTNLGCKMGETCGWDDSCNSACIAACTLSCGQGETCTKDGDGNQSCSPVQTFDAGAIAISGTNMPISVYPPYGWKTTNEGSPYAPGADLHVYASGPTGAGFASFDVGFKATTLLEANPPLDQLSLADIFGDADLRVGWIPGNDRVYVVASGAGGSARCLADDTKGAFYVPRDVLSAVVGDKDAKSLLLSLQRVRLERHQDQKTVGSLDDQTIQKHAWLDLETTSTESIAVHTCGSNETACGAKCVDTDSDSSNCGSCGNSCNGGSCNAGSCQSSQGGSCASCQSSANSGACASSYASCTGSCQALMSCVAACSAGDTTCQSGCYDAYPSGQSAFEDYVSCLGSACASECGGGGGA